MTNIRTPLCERLGIDVPIISAGMGPISGPRLAAAVSNAGGLGMLALDTPEPSSNNTGLLVGIVVAVATGVVALGGAAWYARRRVIR